MARSETRAGDPIVAAPRNYSCPHCYGSRVVMMGRENEHGESVEEEVACRRCKGAESIITKQVREGASR